ncbi:MAG: carbamoyltransferase HypF [Caldilineaceae bacterium]|nr:carbamoyltransferase HypF [Caldilineaceae bacterium]
MHDLAIQEQAAAEKESPARLRLRIEGVVQGVGFRPFVYGLATRLGLSGFVGNDCAGVFVEIEGSAAALSAFQRRLTAEPPPLAHIERVTSLSLPVSGEVAFTIVHSQADHATHTLISPDLSICDDCLRELFDPHDRRYRYPFINCTNCGPRFTIIQETPYDRPLTTMAAFDLCPDCQREYESPDNRRFHAQPNACPNCGPQLEFRWSNDQIPAAFARCFTLASSPIRGEAALQQAQQLLARGGIVAIKGIGGFHLACDAGNERAVTILRQRKARGDKPFALMARDLASVMQIAVVNTDTIALLTSRERPIVLLKKRQGSALAAQVAPGNRDVGVMLPYSPLHYLLFAPALSPDALQPPSLLVMTSGNHAGEPIVTDNDAALTELTSMADAFLLHNRPIHTPCDDSVLRLYNGNILPIRRSRGYAPMPVKLPVAVPPILGVGGEIKNAFCLAQDQHAFLSQHIGDMQNLETLQSFTHAAAHMQKLFRIQPQRIACDLHPGYLSTRWAEKYVNDQGGDLQLVPVQHHHAHVASLMVEHGLPGDRPVIGFCFDGTGYGPDGAIWGGEVLVADYCQYERVAHLNYFPLPGGDAAIRRPYRTALAALWGAGIAWDDALPPVAAATSTERGVLQRQLEVGLNCVPTSSMGRLFDVVAALVGICQTAGYEAQAAIELEALVSTCAGSYQFAMPTAANPVFDATPLLQAVVDDLLNQVPPAVIASRFHKAVANLIFEMSLRLRDQTGLDQVALTGGVFQNMALLWQTTQCLQAAHFEVLVHQSVPPNDGGLALGQVLVAAHQEKRSCA